MQNYHSGMPQSIAYKQEKALIYVKERFKCRQLSEGFLRMNDKKDVSNVVY
jgi:hypothetical protein